MGKLFAILFLLIIITGISGCTINPQANGTFGEKKPVSVSDLEIINSSGAPYQYEGKTTYTVSGVIQNNFGEDTKYVKMEAITFDKNGEIIATNNSVELDPRVIPGKGRSNFYFDFEDPYSKIVKYQIKIIEAG